LHKIMRGTQFHLCAKNTVEEAKIDFQSYCNPYKRSDTIPRLVPCSKYIQSEE
jgi:hypothetical protein